jgi:hypothetical protein
MTGHSTAPYRGASLRALAGGLLLVTLAGCADDRVGPTSTSALAPDSTLTATDPVEPANAILDTRSKAPGVTFGSWNLDNSYLNNVHTGWGQGGPLDPKNILSKLSGARSRGGRVVIKLCKGRDDFVKNADGTFSLSKWKSLVSRYRNINLGPYIADGTILGHYLIDEPHREKRWGGKAISQATIEEMARYSKQLWPSMNTLVRVVPSWLASASVTYKHLDAGWTQYERFKGDPKQWVTAEAAAARRKGLGLVVGLNVLDGGNGSSGIPGWTKGKYAMSATEIRNIGYALLSEGLACGLFNWTHDTDYYGRSTIKSAMADVSARARSHAKTSCRQ